MNKLDGVTLTAGAAMAIAMVEALREEGVITAEQQRNIYRKAMQKTGNLTHAADTDSWLTQLIKDVKE